MTINGMSKASLKIFKTLMILSVIFLIASYFFAMLLGLQVFLFTAEGRAFSTRVYPLPILLFLLFQVKSPLVLSLGYIFLLIWSIYVLCFLVAWVWTESFHRVIKNAFSRPLSHLFSNFLFVLPILASMLFLGVIALQYFQESTLGIPTGEPVLPEDPFETFFLLAYSPLIEEIGFRLSPIGLFLIIYVFWAGRKLVAGCSSKHLLKLLLVAPVFPGKAKRMVGLKSMEADGFGGISVAEWVMVLVTSLVFGLAHLLSGIGWEIGKVTSTFMVGLIFGLAYLAYGFQAPILLHWYFNYYFYTYDLATDLYPSTFSIEVLISFVNIVVGIFGLLALLSMVLHRMFGKKEVQEMEHSPISVL